MEKYREWVEYFEALDGKGIPYSLSDMRSKARELGLPIPSEVDEKCALERKWR